MQLLKSHFSHLSFLVFYIRNKDAFCQQYKQITTKHSQRGKQVLCHCKSSMLYLISGPAVHYQQKCHKMRLARIINSVKRFPGGKAVPNRD